MTLTEERKINGSKVALMRVRLGLSQQKLADLVGLQQAGVNTVEKEYRAPSGVLRSTSVEKFIKLAQVLKTNMHYLADDIEDHRPIQEIMDELDGLRHRGLVVTPDNKREMLTILLEEARQLSEDELRMLNILVKRIVGTSSRPTTAEGSEAAHIIDKLPTSGREKALAAVRRVEEHLNHDAGELEQRMDYLLSLVEDVSGSDARIEIERRFRVAI